MAEVRKVGVRLDIPASSSTNLREHWAVRHRRVKGERSAAGMALRASYGLPPDRTAPIVVRLTRLIGPKGRALDDDNLRGALKAFRDGVADWLKRPDNAPTIRWEYDQRKAETRGVQIDVEPGSAP